MRASDVIAKGHAGEEPVVYHPINPLRKCKMCGAPYKLTEHVQTRSICGRCVPEYRTALRDMQCREDERVQDGIFRPLALCSNRGSQRMVHIC